MKCGNNPDAGRGRRADPRRGRKARGEFRANNGEWRIESESCPDISANLSVRPGRAQRALKALRRLRGPSSLQTYLLNI
jgi:hypothetical protein